MQGCVVLNKEIIRCGRALGLRRREHAYLQKSARLAREGGGLAVVGLHVGVKFVGEIDELVDQERISRVKNEWIDLN